MVAIASVQGSDIIGHAKNSTKKYENGVIKENYILDSYLAKIEENINGTIDYNAIEEIYNKMNSGEITPEEALEQIDEKIGIENMDGSSFFINDEPYNYFYKIDGLYKIDMTNMKFKYCEKEKNIEEYSYARNLENARKDLENIFLGKTYIEIKEKYNEGELNDYVLNNSKNKNIISINFRNQSHIKTFEVLALTFKNGDSQEIFELENQSIDIELNEETQVYDNVVIFMGS